ncbi:hypothetical protein [Shinella sp.]|uniref:hypothetical protein n=1 Tax=Shinella sp. TaxID=1870904 RepID=UPI002586A364|nr:hypothetical protein [Shinella sp.]MCW5706105.1 hypothetical protein [Shinella sp.]
MTVDWEAAKTAAIAAVHSAFAETVRLSPTKNGAPDPDRPQVNINAILHHPSVDGAISVGNGIITTISASAHALVVDRHAYPDLVVRAKDKVRATSRAGTPLFEVSKVSDRHSGVLILELGES